VKSVKDSSDVEHSSIEANYGHTESEWGKSVKNAKKEPSFIYSYEMKWETTDE